MVMPPRSTTCRGRDRHGGVDVTERTCSVEGCYEPHVARSYCARHWRLNRPEGGYPIPTRLERFYSHVALGHGEVCDRWTGSINSWGYGQLRVDGRGRIAHRWIYEQLVGPIPEGLDLGHTCHDRDPFCPGGDGCLHRQCVTIAHLEPMTRSKNMRDGKISGRTNRCKWGHEWTEANTYITKAGHRLCRACNVRRQGELQAARRAAGWRRRGNLWVRP